MTIADLKNRLNMKTTNLALLGFATAGIFPIMWLYRHAKDIDEITKAKVSDDVYVIWIAVCTGIGLALRALDGGDTLVGIGVLFELAASVLWIIWAFRARKALENYALLEHKIELKMNVFYTFFFHVFYVNYCINDLPELERKKMILSGGKQTSSESGS